MKTLFLIFHGFEEHNGISKKIRYQIHALEEYGLDVRICYTTDENGHKRRFVDNEVLVDYGSGIKGKILKRIEFNSIARYVKDNKIEFVYMRCYQNANPFLISMLNKIRKTGAKIVMEIPTYPYDKEYITLQMKLELLVDKCFRRCLAQRIDKIVTFSNHSVIFNIPTIQISNGIDFEQIKVKEHMNDTSSALQLIGVAEIHYWHGFDRLLNGMAEYYKSSPDYKVYFHIVGNLTGERERELILTIIEANSLQEYVFLHGACHGEELDELFERADMGIGSLGRHRSGITHIKTLKNREYSARGLPFIYSETDSDFDKCPFVLKVSANETPVDINELILFYRSNSWVSTKIRNSVKNLSWKNQMEKVINQTYINPEI